MFQLRIFSVFGSCVTKESYQQMESSRSDPDRITLTQESDRKFEM